MSDGLLYTPSGPPTEDSIKSYLNPTGSCYDWEGGKGYFPLTLIGDLSALSTWTGYRDNVISSNVSGTV